MRPLDLARYPEAVHLVGAPFPPPDGTPYERPRAGREKEGGKEGEGKTGKEKEGEGKEGGECGGEVRAATTPSAFSVSLWTPTLSPFTSAPFPRLGPSPANDAIPGYMPLRGDFDVEHDNEVLSLPLPPSFAPFPTPPIPPFSLFSGTGRAHFGGDGDLAGRGPGGETAQAHGRGRLQPVHPSPRPPALCPFSLPPSGFTASVDGRFSYFSALRVSVHSKVSFSPPFRRLPLPFFSPGNWTSERNARRLSRSTISSTTRLSRSVFFFYPSFSSLSV
jgi:hypothetical protein